MTDAERVAAIEREAELALLPLLLEEARRPVPPGPNHAVAALRQQLIQVMQLLCDTYPDGNRRRLPRLRLVSKVSA